MEINKIKCTCSCHTSKGMMMHMQACCDNGWITVPVVDTKEYVKDGTWLRYYESDGNVWTIGHHTLFDGKIELNPEWKIVKEEMGKVYIVKPKKDEA